MITVGLKTWGSSKIKQTKGIKFESCITYKELNLYDVCLLENCKDEELEKVKGLKGKVYTIGATGKQVATITHCIEDVSEITDTATEVKQEKERSIEIIKKINEEKEDAVKKQFETSNENESLRVKVATLTRTNELNENRIKELETELEETKGNLDGEKAEKKRIAEELDRYKNDLGTTIIENKAETENFKESLNKEHTREIAEIKEIIADKDTTIEKKDKEIEDLKYKVQELSKKGSIPEIVYKYNGNAKIITVVGQGSYGVSNLVYSITQILKEKKKNILVVDLDLKGGNLGKYFKKEEVYTIEEALKGNEIKKTVIMKDFSGQCIDYIGGVKEQAKPSDVIMLKFEEIFKGDIYDYIIVDGGIYGGYNIQTTVDNMLMRNGNIINIHVGKELLIEGKENIFNIKNFDVKGIPKQMQMYATKETLYDNTITKRVLMNNIEQWCR